MVEGSCKEDYTDFSENSKIFHGLALNSLSLGKVSQEKSSISFSNNHSSGLPPKSPFVCVSNKSPQDKGSGEKKSNPTFRP